VSSAATIRSGMTHQTVADHFNMSRITISKLMIRLRKTCRTNDRPRKNRPRMTSQRRHLLLVSVTEQDVIVCFVRINTFHANIDVNDNKQLFGF
jgi:transposase